MANIFHTTQKTNAAEQYNNKAEYLEYVYADLAKDIYINLKTTSLHSGGKRISQLFSYYATEIAQEFYGSQLNDLILNLLSNPQKSKQVRYVFRGLVHNTYCWLLLKISPTESKHAFISLTKLNEDYNKTKDEIASIYC